MHGLLRLPMGGIYWVGRWALLVYKWVWSGALCMAAVYTLTAWLTTAPCACHASGTA